VNPVLRGFLAYQAGGILVLGAFYFIATQSGNPHPLRSSIKVWAAYAAVFAAISAVDFMKRRQHRKKR
jgi:hypothetical protein